MEQANTRLRKTFHYPDNEPEEENEALDEEEQDHLIDILQAKNRKSNELYTKAFLSVPILAVIPYLLQLFQPRTSLLSVLSISSLFSSAYILRYFPHNKTGIQLLDDLNKPKTQGGGDRLPKLGDVVDNGPVQLYLATMNAILCGLCVLGGITLSSNAPFLGFGLVPGSVFGMVLMAKYVMAGVDVGELERLRYGYKGA